MTRVSTRMRQWVGEEALLLLLMLMLESVAAVDVGRGKCRSCVKVAVIVSRREGGTMQPRGGTLDRGNGVMCKLSLSLSLLLFFFLPPVPLSL